MVVSGADLSIGNLGTCLRRNIFRGHPKQKNGPSLGRLYYLLSLYNFIVHNIYSIHFLQNINQKNLRQISVHNRFQHDFFACLSPISYSDQCKNKAYTCTWHCFNKILTEIDRHINLFTHVLFNVGGTLFFSFFLHYVFQI